MIDEKTKKDTIKVIHDLFREYSHYCNMTSGLWISHKKTLEDFIYWLSSRI